MRFLVCFILLLCCFSAPSYAQFKEKKDEQTIDQRLGITPHEEKRKSSGEEKRDLSLQYYDECMLEPSTLIPAKAYELYCGCISNEIYSQMSLVDIQEMRAGTPKGQTFRDEARINIAGRCLKYPLREFSMAQCIENKAFRKNFGHRRNLQVCTCAADTAGRFADKHGETLMEAAYFTDVNPQDPIGVILMNEDYGRTMAAYLQRCIQIHVLDLP